MPDWWNERLYADCHQSFLVKEVLYDRRSAFQHIQILETVRFGRALALDGIIQTTEADDFIYHEMLVHPAIERHGNPLRAVIIGGGDGGAAREILQWSNVRQIDLIEIDPEVISVAKQFLPTISRGALEDPRVVVKLQDGSRFVQSAKASYDIVVIDSSDPIGPATSLFSRDFYGACLQSLRVDGVLVAQCGVPFMAKDQLLSAFGALASHARHVAVYLSAVPTYYGGTFAFLLASDSCRYFVKHFLSVDGTRSPIERHTRHYSAALNERLFVLPKWLVSELKELRPRCEICGF
jgi:spermidine synthase